MKNNNSMRLFSLVILIISITSSIAFGQYRKKDIYAVSKKPIKTGCIVMIEKTILLKDSTFIKTHSSLTIIELLNIHSKDSLKNNTWKVHNDTLTLYEKVNRRGSLRIFYTNYIKVKRPNKEIRNKINSDFTAFRRNFFFKWYTIERRKMVID